MSGRSVWPGTIPASGRMSPLTRVFGPCRREGRVSMLTGMFIRYFLDLSLPHEEVEVRFLSSPEAWVPGLARDAEDRGDHLMAEVGFSFDDDRRVNKEVEIEIGVPLRMQGRTVLPLTWKATGPKRLFPSLDADLEIAALGTNRTQLSFSARYQPPLGAVGKALDRALLHRVAEATVKDFLDRVGEGIAAPMSAESVSGRSQPTVS